MHWIICNIIFELKDFAAHYDFLKGLINAARDRFPNPCIVYCFSISNNLSVRKWKIWLLKNK